MKQVVVTRHPALVEVLKQDGMVDSNCTVIQQATADDVSGNHVIGVLPLHLAAKAAKVTVLNLNTPMELRGQELTVEQLREYSDGYTTYKVEVVD